MGLFSSNSNMSTDPEIRKVEKLIANEAKADKQGLNHAIRDLDKTQKAQTKSNKSATKAQQNVDKAVKKQHTAAKALNKAQHQHDDAVANQQNAEKTLELQKQHVARLEQDVQQRKSSLDDMERRKQINDHERESRLSQIHSGTANGTAPIGDNVNGNATNGIAV